MAETRTSEQLAPCPFCGSASAPEVLTEAQIQCTGCDTYTCDCECHSCEERNVAVCCVLGNGGCGATGRYDTSPKKAAAAWNRRAA